MLSLNLFVQLIFFVLLLSSGQILFKKTAQENPPINNIDGLFALVGNIWFWLAVVLYGAATLFWIIILQKVKLSIAYPFSALGFIIIPCAAWFFFDEKISLPYALGSILIIAGVCLISVKH